MSLSPDQIKDAAEKTLRRRVHQNQFRLLAECLGTVEVSVLTSFGVDVREKLLQILVEEATQLLKGDMYAHRQNP